MKAMILAAGRGERMRPLTDNCPKPLLKVKGTPLIEYHIKNLVRAGITNIVINHAWLGEQIVNCLGNGARLGASITYSKEPKALETAGGIIKALDTLADNEDDVFIVINGDVFSNFDYQNLPEIPVEQDAHLMLVTNPEHNLNGDFIIKDNLLANPCNASQQTYTFSGIALYRKRFFQKISKVEATNQRKQVLPLAPMLRLAADHKKVAASFSAMRWTDVGTPERLAKLNESY